MKRILLFVLLFGGGLAALLYLSKESRRERKERLDQEQEQIVEEGRSEELPFAELPTPAEAPGPGADQGDGGDNVKAVVRGKISLSIFEEESGLLLYDFRADHVEPVEGDEYDITGITAHLYDTERTGSGEPLVHTTLVAEGGRARLEQVGTELRVGYTERVKLVNAVVTLHEGSPMAPIDLHLPTAEADFRSNSFYSDGEVRIEGDGVHGTGLGLVAEQDKQRLELQRQGYLRLDSEGDTQIELFANPGSPIVFEGRSAGDTVDKVEVDLARGGRLVAQGDQPLAISGRALNLVGQVVQLEEPNEAAPEEVGPKQVFLPEYAKAEREVVFEHVEDLVTGGLAEVRFDSRGQVKRLQMSESPMATGVLELGTIGGEEEEPVEARISGAGPMVLEYVEDSPVARFELPGPATLEVPARRFRLDASEKVEGSYWGRGLVHLVLRGAVDGSFEDMVFEGSEVDLRGSQLDEERPRLFLETEEPAHLSGADADGNPVDMRTRDVLQLALEGGRPSLVLAKDVTFELVDESLWTVTVAELKDMDFEAGTFLAEGDVQYTGAMGSGTAVRAIGHSRERIELFGSEQRLATYDVYPDASPDLDMGLIRARHIDLTPEYARADDAVQLRFSGGDYSESIDCSWFELRPKTEADDEGPTAFTFEAREITRAVLSGAGAEAIISADTVSGEGIFNPSSESGSSIVLEELEAMGAATVDYAGRAGNFVAKGGRIEWRPGSGGRLEAPQGERVEARGRFEADGLPYVLTASWIEYSDGEIQALFPEITLDRPEALPQLLSGRASTELYGASAEWMTADGAGLMLSGVAHFSGKSAEGEPIDLDAGQIHVRRSAEGDERGQGVEEMVAWDGFSLRAGDDLVGTGEVLQAGYDVLRMEGRPAKLDVRGFEWESNNIVYDVPQVLVSTDQGRLRGAAGSGAEDWEVSYESLQPFDDEDSTMLVMRNPVMQGEGREVRANWAIFWLDRDEWLTKTQEWLSTGEGQELPAGPEPQAEAVRAPTLFGRFDVGSISRVLKEVYFEGDIVYIEDGERDAMMEAAYVDLVDGHGWIQGCEIYIDAKVGRVRTGLTVRADWLRHSADGSLSADHAEITACDFADPHYYIRTQNLRLVPIDDASSVWDVSLKDNALVFDNGLKVPLPRVSYKSDGKGRPTFSGLSFGDSARYGTFVGASATVDVGRQASKAIAPLLGATPEQIDGNYRIKASYSSRGLLLDQRFRLTAADHFWLNVYLEGIYDTGEDRGMLRYKDPGTDGFRWVLHVPARYSLTDEEWFDLVFSTQSDPGVQSEFMEAEFVDYERRNTYLRWRKADDEMYYSAIVRYRANTFRNDVERLPEVGALRGLTPIGNLWGQEILYTGSVDMAYLRRREGTSTLVSPFDPVFDDGLGNRDVVRGDTRHQVETPFELGVGGLRISPYAALVGTAWSEGVDPATAPTRGSVIAGIEAQTTAFRTWSHGVVNSVTPFVGYRGDLASFEDDGTPVEIDRLDDPVNGRFMDVGLRSRWRVPGGARYLDVSVRGTHADEAPAGEEEGWRPLRVLGELLAVIAGVPFAIIHDAQYDLDDRKTPISYTSLSLLPHPDVGVEVSYNRGLDEQRELLYDAVGVGLRWDATLKWQVEGRQSVSNIDNAELASELLLRRLGHDFVFELSYGYRSGEGGNSLTFSYRPLLGWRPPNFGSMQALQQARL